MKKYLFAYAVLATALLFFTCRHYRAENRRLVENQTALAADVTRYRTRLGAEAASVQALRLRCGEFETLRAADAEQIRRLGIRLRRLEAAAKAFDEITDVLGLMYNRRKDEVPAEVTELVEKRAAAKKAKDWATADAIRAQLTEMGWAVKDTAQGPQLSKL